jgi:pimeloyl-ACP methyl ester carboxylesterase
VQEPIDARVRMRDGIELHVREHRPDVQAAAHAEVGADARPFLLVHGLSSNARLWDGVGRALAAAGHRSIAVDLRAHGRSDPSDALTFPTLVDDLARIMDATGLDRPVAVGQSWGGNVVLELGASQPDLVRGVVGVDGGLIDLAARFPDVAACWEALAPPTLDHLRWEDLTAGIGQRLGGWPEGAVEAQLGNLTADPSDGRVRAILTRERHRSIVEHLYAHRPLDRLAALEVPMLLLAVTGGSRTVLDEDRLEVARMAARAGLDVVRLPGRDHDVHLQEPATVTDLLLRWSSGGGVPELVA